MNIPAAIDVAKKLLKEKKDLFAALETVRSDLRNAVVRKEGTPDEQKWIQGQFPVRHRTRTAKGV
jgi:hypothetical protein